MANFMGVPQGIERGVRLGLMIDAAGQRKEDRAQAARMQKLQEALTGMQLGNLLDNQFREKASQQLNAAQFQFEQLQARAKSGEQVAPEEIERARETLRGALNFTYRDFINQNVDPGTYKELAGFIPTQRGTFVPQLAIKDKNTGQTIKTAPMTPNRSSEDQTVMEFSEQDVADLIPWTQSVIAEIEAARVGHGDMGPIEGRRAAAAKADERSWEREKLDIQHRNRLEQIRTSARTGAAGGAATADIQASEWLLRNNPGMSPDQAYRIVRMAKSDPVSSVTELAGLLMKHRADTDILGENPLSPEEAMAQAEELVQSVRDRYVSAGWGAGANEEQDAPTDAGGAPSGASIQRVRAKVDGKWVELPVDDVLESARRAITEKGKDRAGVIQRLREMGITDEQISTSGL